MAILLAVVCVAVSAFLMPKGSNAAARRLSGQLSRASPARSPRGNQAMWHRGGKAGCCGAGRGRAKHCPRAGGRSRKGGGPEGCGNPDEACRKAENERRDVLMRRAASTAAGVLCFVVFGGIAGMVVGAVAGLAVWHSFRRLGNAERKRTQSRLVADLPVAVDLLAACLRGGTPWHAAVEAVADAVGGPLGDELRGVAVQIRLGADPTEAWLALVEEPMMAPLAHTAVRATSSGAALAPSLSRLARDQRRVARTAAAARARAAGIRALAPLGLCFLPAFVLLGVVPAIAGIASTILLPW